MFSPRVDMLNITRPSPERFIDSPESVADSLDLPSESILEEGPLGPLGTLKLPAVTGP